LVDFSGGIKMFKIKLEGKKDKNEWMNEWMMKMKVIKYEVNKIWS
jgi:hypothetical protein